MTSGEAHTDVVRAVDFLRVTEGAALASGRWLGRGDAEAAERAAVEAMRQAVDELPVSGTLVIGEGGVDEAPELYVGQVVGAGGMPCDMALDPLEGTGLVARGDAGAISVCVVAESGGVRALPDMYMRKLCVGATARGQVDIRAPIDETLAAVATAFSRKVRDLTVIVLDRPRHAGLIEDVRSAGARIRLIPDGDITASLSAAVRGTGDHLYVGIGGSTEGLITAAIMECLSGEIQAQMWPRTDEERQRLAETGIADPDDVLHTRDLVPAPLYVLATGVTDGTLLTGVRYFSDGARTHSIVMDLRANTVRFIDTIHLFDRAQVREIRL
ncbi:MAG: fructose,6-bisphosphatase [Miltoncostaeaceae bacterium]|jgi:fructose-1,6-bisphosphatase II|nr:fructose,6-bisphosphatase [Miltoncostaeaceae bacterium]